MLSVLFEILIAYTAVRYFPILIILALAGIFIFMKVIDWVVPDYMVQHYDSESPVATTNVKVTTKTKVIAEKPKSVKTKTKVVQKSKPLNSYKYKMARFEEEAFWMNVFDDEEGC